MGPASGLFGRALRSLEMAAAMLTDAGPFPYLGTLMTIYRCDLQQYIATDLVSTGRYYWTNVYYFNADDDTEFDLGRDACATAQSRAFCHDVHSDRILITVASTGTIVQHGSFSWVPFGVLPASDSPITNTVLVWLYSEGVRVGYKRYRVPVPMAGMSNGLLTPEFIASYYVNGPANILSDGTFCSRTGAVIDNAIVDPLVRGWQIRHGTKRAERRAV